MKFRDIANIIKSVDFKLLPMVKTEETRNYKIVQYFTYTKKQKDELKKLLDIPSIKKEYESIFNDNIFNTTMTEFPNDITFNKISKIIEYDIIPSFEFYIKNFDILYPKLNDTSLCIKLPDTKDLNEIGKYCIEINKLLNQVVVNDSINGRIEFVNVDLGSTWLDICVGTTLAMQVVGTLIYSACYIRNQKLKFKLYEEEYRKVKIQNDVLEAIATGNKELIKSYIELESRNIMDSYYPEQKDNAELCMRIKNTINEFSEMINKGLEVHPALEVAKNIKTEYPDFSHLLNVTSKVKELENKKENNEQ